MLEAESETPAAKPKRKSRRRGCLVIALVALALLVPGFYWFEHWSGRRALEKAMARYEAAGLSLDPAAFLPGEGPPEENFGAIPLLDGIMRPDDGSPAGNKAKAKMEVIKALLPQRAVSPPPRTKGAKPSKPPPVTEIPALTGLTTDWAKVRAFLDAHTPCKPPPDEPSDALAVFLALDTHRAVFDELVAALSRPRAYFTPSPLERSRKWSLESAGIIPSVVMPLIRLIALRAHAAVACGKLEEVPPLAHLLWKFRQAAQSDSLLMGKLIAQTFESMWCAVAQAMLNAPGVTDSMLTELAAIIPPDWSPEQELLHTYRSETAFVLFLLESLRDLPAEQMGYGGADFQGRMIRFGPSGWVAFNAATLLQRRLEYVLLPLQFSGFKSLPPSLMALRAGTQSWSEHWSPYTFLQDPGSDGVMIRLAAHRSFQTRLTQLAIGMERHRLKHGRYPADAAALVPGSIAAVPLDMDGAPLRLTVSPDGASAVLYSIGWNLTDDWHGSMARYKEIAGEKNDDWPLALPISPSP